MKHHLLSFLFTLVALQARSEVFGQSLAPSAVATTRPVLQVAKATVIPKVDASWDDPAWERAGKIDALSLCLGPQAKGLTPSATKVRVLWDEHYLYVRFICQDADIYAPHGKELNAVHSQGDVAEVFIDPVGDSRQFIEIEINPVGGIFQGTHVLTTQPVSGIDGVLKQDVIARDWWFFLNLESKEIRSAASQTSRDGNLYWIADLAIPAEPLLHRMGSKTFKPMELRANFLRYDAATPLDGQSRVKTIDMNWSPVQWGRPPSLAGGDGHFNFAGSLDRFCSSRSGRPEGAL